MKIIKKTLFGLAILLLLISLVLFCYILYLKPTEEGEQTLNTIKKQTTVYFDEYGIPHIYANSQEDAMTTLGYVHAQDRLWQMELMRRIAPGKLSEIFGSVMLKNDKFFSGLGIAENTEKNIAKLDKNWPVGPRKSYKST